MPLPEHSSVLMGGDGFSMRAPPPPAWIRFGDIITIDMNTLDITIREGVTVPEAAKVFWNSVCLCVGKAPLFPDAPLGKL